MVDWGVLDGDTPPAGAAPPAPAPAPDRGWGQLDGYAPSAARGAIPSQPVPGRHRERPAPEAASSLLRAGETVWAQVDGAGATLGAGQLITLTGAPPDGLNGWRLVRVLDPDRLLAEVIPVPVATLADGVGDDPVSLYRPDDRPIAAGVARQPGFPVGAGPDLRAMLDRRIAEANARFRHELDDARRRAEYEQHALRQHISRLEGELEEATRRRRPGLFGRGDA